MSRKHIRAYLMVGGTLLLFTGHHRRSLLRQFRNAEGQRRGRDARRHVQSRPGRRDLHASLIREEMIYRILIFTFFSFLDFSGSPICLVRSDHSLNVAERFSHCFHHLLHAARARCWAPGAFGSISIEGAPVFRIGAICSFAAAVALDHLRRLVLSKNETASDYHMKAKLLVAFVLFSVRRPDRLWPVRFAMAQKNARPRNTWPSPFGF